MNLIRKVRVTLLPVLAVLVLFSCEDSSKAPIVTFDTAGKGAFIKSFRANQTGSTGINILTQANFDASSFGYSVEFVDGQGGTRVTNYTLTVSYDDATGSAGDLPAVTLRTYDASSFTAAASGNLGVPNISITGPELVAAHGLTYGDLSPNDVFEIQGTITTDDGSVWSSSNSSAPIRGTAFQGWFDWDMTATCPSSLGGTYAYSSTGIWCDPTATVTGMITISATGGGNYDIDDWSFGGYGHCYSAADGAGWGGLSFIEVCGVVSFNGFTDAYGDDWTFVHSATGTDWTISWSNTFGESGATTITFPGGVPFTTN